MEGSLEVSPVAPPAGGSDESLRYRTGIYGAFFTFIGLIIPWYVITRTGSEGSLSYGLNLFMIGSNFASSGSTGLLITPTFLALLSVTIVIEVLGIFISLFHPVGGLFTLSGALSTFLVFPMLQGSLLVGSASLSHGPGLYLSIFGGVVTLLGFVPRREMALGGTVFGRAERVAGATAAAQPVESGPLLDVRNLTVRFFTYDGVIKALDGVNFNIRGREIFGIVGETGCGKSVTAKAVLRVIPDPPGRITGGEVLYGGLNLLDSIEEEADIHINSRGRARVHRRRRLIRRMETLMQTIRGNQISMIFQEPSAALNPVMTVETQVREVLMNHQLAEICDALPNTEAFAPLQRSYIRLLRHRDAQGMAMEETLRALSARSGVRRAAQAAGDIGTATAVSDEIQALEARVRGLHWRLRLTDIRLRLLERFSLFDTAPFVLSYFGALALLAIALLGGGGAFGIPLAIGAAAGLLWYSSPPFNLRLHWTRTHVQRPVLDETHRRVVEMLKQVRIPDPERKAESYPFELSGGMQQRVMIAMALACRPRLLLADEPTTALDVTIQAQILSLIRELRDKFGSSIMLITHDLGVVAETCDRVGVMYAGVMAEIGSVADIFERPVHPYTVGLMRSIPEAYAKTGKLSIIPGSVPSLLTPPGGCRFHPRCPFASPSCAQVVPALAEASPGHFVSCHLYDHPEFFPPETVAARDRGLTQEWEKVTAA